MNSTQSLRPARPDHSSNTPRVLLAGALALLLGACTSSSGGGGGKGGATGQGSGGSAGQGNGGSAGSGGRNGGSGGSAKGGSGGNNNGGSGGSAGGGGSGGKGGSAGGGGAAGSGGSAKGGSGGNNSGGSGGSAGSGGVAGSGGNGGAAGSGGTAGSGGAAGGGGSAGSGGTAGSGGSGGGDGGAGGGNTAPAPGDLKCKDPVYGDVSIPGIQVISDFETDSLYQSVQDGRGKDALPWYAYAKGDTNDSYNIMQTAGPLNPLNASNVFKVDASVHGPCSSKGALHVKSPGPATTDDYVGWGIDFMARPAPDKKKQAYDGSKYTGVGFWAKCNTELQFAFEKVVDAVQDADINTSVVPTPCSYSSGTICNQFGVKNTVFTKDWSYHKMFFSELLQDPNGKTFTDGIDSKKLIAFQVHVNPFSPRSGSAKVNPIDCYFDDVHFLTEAAPKPPTETVTWSIDGTTIKRNGSAYKIRGLVRPSMEWDCAGFGITREDAQRMKAWHANAVRLAVKDTLWAGASTGNTTCDGGAYQKQVKRAINWLLEQKMDVILDLHYVGGSPNADHAKFWDSISKDSFFKDGRIIFELYNEPTDGVDNLRKWANSTIATIRANGAKNLILVSGPDYTYDLSGYVTTPVTDSANTTAYAVHPYIFKSDPNAWKAACAKLPVVATEFGDANVQEIGHSIPATQCEASIYSNYISSFETIGMSWTSWAWIVDEWGCGFPQLLTDYSGTPNAIGTPVKDQLTKLNP